MPNKLELMVGSFRIHIMASSYPTAERWHPAIAFVSSDYDKDERYYWPNVTEITQEEALKFARAAVDDVRKAAWAIIQQWNIHQV